MNLVYKKAKQGVKFVESDEEVIEESSHTASDEDFEYQSHVS